MKSTWNRTCFLNPPGCCMYRLPYEQVGPHIKGSRWVIFLLSVSWNWHPHTASGQRVVILFISHSRGDRYRQCLCLGQSKIRQTSSGRVVFTRTFLLKSSYTLLHMLECLKLHASPFNKFNMWDFLWKYQVILVIAYIFIINVINYALWHTFESKRYHGYMYFHNKTWYTRIRCYIVVTYITRIGYNALFTPLIAKACVVQWIECRPPVSRGLRFESRRRQILFIIFIEVYRIFSDFYLYSR